MASEHLEPTKEKPISPNLRRPGATPDVNGHGKNGHSKIGPDDIQLRPEPKSADGILGLSDFYMENTEFTAGKIKALLGAQITYTRGLHDMQKAYLDLVHRSLELAQRATRDLIRCTSASAAAEVHRDLLREGMDQLFEGSAKVFRASNQAADEAIRSIESQIGRLS